MIVEAVTERLIRRYLDNINKYTPEEMADMRFDIAVQSALNTMKLREAWILLRVFSGSGSRTAESSTLRASKVRCFMSPLIS